MSPRSPNHRLSDLRWACIVLASFGSYVGAAEDELEPDDDEHTISFSAPVVEAFAGDTVNAAISVRSSAGLSLAAFSLKYDTAAWNVSPPVLSQQVQEIVDRNPTGSAFISDLNETSGWVQSSVITDFNGDLEYSIPAGGAELVTLSITVKEGTPAGSYPIHFGEAEDDGEEDDFKTDFEDSLGNPVYNHARREGTRIEDGSEYDDDGDDIQLTDGAIIVSILGDVNVFARGDANSDKKIDISDPVTILGYLFLGMNNVTCEDACDSNDDGQLDLSDSVTMLHFLFSGSEGGASFTTQLAVDSTPDPLGCAYY